MGLMSSLISLMRRFEDGSRRARDSRGTCSIEVARRPEILFGFFNGRRTTIFGSLN